MRVARNLHRSPEAGHWARDVRTSGPPSEDQWLAVVDARPDAAVTGESTPALHRGFGLAAPGPGVGRHEPFRPPAARNGEPANEPPAVAAPTAPETDEHLLWVTRAVEECGRAFTRLASRLAQVEVRLDALEATPPREPAAPAALAGTEQIEARIDESAAQARRRLDRLEERLRQLDFLPLKVSNLNRAVDQLATSQPRVATPPTPPRVVSEVDELRRELAATQQRLAALDARVSTTSIAVAVQDEVRRYAERVAAEAPAGPLDLEGLYRELDAVAEFVAARAAATAESLERIGPLETAVLDLRRELSRAVAELGAAPADADLESRVRAMEARLRTVESSGKRIDRLYSALHDIVRVAPEERRTTALSAAFAPTPARPPV